MISTSCEQLVNDFCKMAEGCSDVRGAIEEAKKNLSQGKLEIALAAIREIAEEAEKSGTMTVGFGETVIKKLEQEFSTTTAIVDRTPNLNKRKNEKQELLEKKSKKIAIEHKVAAKEPEKTSEEVSPYISEKRRQQESQSSQPAKRHEVGEHIEKTPPTPQQPVKKASFKDLSLDVAEKIVAYLPTSDQKSLGRAALFSKYTKVPPRTRFATLSNIFVKLLSGQPLGEDLQEEFKHCKQLLGEDLQEKSEHCVAACEKKGLLPNVAENIAANPPTSDQKSLGRASLVGKDTEAFCRAIFAARCSVLQSVVIDPELNGLVAEILNLNLPTNQGLINLAVAREEAVQTQNRTKVANVDNTIGILIAGLELGREELGREMYQSFRMNIKAPFPALPKSIVLSSPNVIKDVMKAIHAYNQVVLQGSAFGEITTKEQLYTKGAKSEKDFFDSADTQTEIKVWDLSYIPLRIEESPYTAAKI